MLLLEEIFKLLTKTVSIDGPLIAISLVILYIIFIKKFCSILFRLYIAENEKLFITMAERGKRKIDTAIVSGFIFSIWLTSIQDLSPIKDNAVNTEFIRTWSLLLVFGTLIGFILQFAIHPILKLFLPNLRKTYRVRLDDKDFKIGEVHSDGTIELHHMNEKDSKSIKLVKKEDLMMQADFIEEDPKPMSKHKKRFRIFNKNPKFDL